MAYVVSFIREHANGFCSREVIPEWQLSDREWQWFIELADSGNHAISGNETIWDVRVYSEEIE